MPDGLGNFAKREKWSLVAAALLAFLLPAGGAGAGLTLIAVFMVLGLALIRMFATDEPAPAKSGEQRVEGPRATDPLSGARAALDAMAIPAFILDPEANVISANPAATHVFGEVPYGQHISARLRSPALLDKIRETIETGEAQEVDHAERLPSEDIYRARIERAATIAGAPVFYVLSFRDISEARRIERIRSDFVANASHELRTPLASLRGFIETMQGPARNDEVAREKFLGIMFEQVTRMSRLVDDLLSLSRLELKSRIAPDSATDLVSVISSVAASLGPLAEELGVYIHLELPEHPVTVKGDHDELTEVFENLIENACKYGQSGGRVDVRLTGGETGQDGPPEIAVIDHGPGISEEHVPRLTERFYRVNVENSRHKKGTGLGLAIVKHILTRHRANLVIRSELGKGSTFIVRF